MMYNTKQFIIRVELNTGGFGTWKITAVNEYMAIDKAYTKHDVEFFGTELAQRDRKKFSWVKPNCKRSCKKA